MSDPWWIPPPRDAPPTPAPGSVARPWSEETSFAVVLGLGLIGGLAVGSWAVKHFFVTGLDDEERRSLLLAGAAAGAVYGVATLLELDEKYWQAEAAARAIEAELSSTPASP